MYSVKQARTDWGINIIILPDFSRTRLEDLLVSTTSTLFQQTKDKNKVSLAKTQLSKATTTFIPFTRPSLAKTKRDHLVH